MWGFPGGSVVKNLPACSAGDPAHKASVPGSGRSPGGRNGNSLIYSYLGNPMDRGALQLQSMVSQRVGLDWACKHALTHSYMLCLLPSKKAHWKLEFHCDFLFNISILFHWPEIALENKLNFFYTLFCTFCQLCFFCLPKVFKIVWSVP